MMIEGQEAFSRWAAQLNPQEQDILYSGLKSKILSKPMTAPAESA